MVTSTTTAMICTEASCQAAQSHVSTCECSCGGVDHGLVHRAGVERALARLAQRMAVDPFLGAANNDDDDFIPAGRRVAPGVDLDEESF